MGADSRAVASQLRLSADNGCCICGSEEWRRCAVKYNALTSPSDVEAIVQVLQAAPSDSSGDRTLAACRALHQLATACRLMVFLELVTPQAIEAVVAVLEACLASGWVLAWSWACLCVAVLGKASVLAEVQLTPSFRGCATALVSGLRVFVDQPEACHAACRAIATLADADESLRHTLFREDIGRHLVAAMRAWSEDRYTAIMGCYLIAVLADGQPAHHRALYDAGACEAVVAAMKAFPNDFHVSILGCDAMGKLGGRHAAARQALCRAGAGEVLVTAMRAWVIGDGNGRLAQAACSTLYQLGRRCDMTVEALGRAGACTAVVEAMRASAFRNIGYDLLGFITACQVRGQTY